MAHFIEDLLLMKNDQTNLKVKPNDFAAMSNYQGVILSKCFAMGFKFACVCALCFFKTFATDKHLILHCPSLNSNV